MELPHITQSNFNEVRESSLEMIKVDREKFLLILKDVLSTIPNKSSMILKLIQEINGETEIKKDVLEILKDVIHSKEPYESISGLCFALGFGINLNISYLEQKKISEDVFKDQVIEIEKDVVDNLKESLDNCYRLIYTNNLDKLSKHEFDLPLENREPTKIEDLNLVYSNESIVFTALQTALVIVNYAFSMTVCLNELQSINKENVAFIAIVYLIGRVDDVYLISLLFRLVKDEHAAKVLLYIFPCMKKDFRDVLISLLYENFCNRKIYKNEENQVVPFNSEEEIAFIRKFIDKETVVVLERYLSPESIRNLVPGYNNIVEDLKSIKRDEFVITDNKKKFFEDFCYLGSPSISHFLSYLEIYKDHFKLNEEEQDMFFRIFQEIFKERESFKKIILGKMCLFKILDSKYIQ